MICCWGKQLGVKRWESHLDPLAGGHFGSEASHPLGGQLKIVTIFDPSPDSFGQEYAPICGCNILNDEMMNQWVEWGTSHCWTNPYPSLSMKVCSMKKHIHNINFRKVKDGYSHEVQVTSTCQVEVDYMKHVRSAIQRQIDWGKTSLNFDGAGRTSAAFEGRNG